MLETLSVRHDNISFGNARAVIHLDVDANLVVVESCSHHGACRSITNHFATLLQLNDTREQFGGGT